MRRRIPWEVVPISLLIMLVIVVISSQPGQIVRAEGSDSVSQDPDTATPDNPGDDKSGDGTEPSGENEAGGAFPLPHRSSEQVIPAETSGNPYAGWFPNRDCNLPLVVMPLGDSITRGSGGGTPGHEDENDYMLGFRYPLYNSLANQGYQFGFVGQWVSGQSSGFTFDYDHNGFGGIRADEVADLLDAPGVYNKIKFTALLPTDPPDLILLKIGSNDISQDDSASVADVQTILNKIDAYDPEIVVVVAKIIDQWRGWTGPQPPAYNPDDSDLIEAFNQNLENLVNSRIAGGDKLVLVDMWSVLDYSLSSTDMWDLKHPTVNGYNKMAAVWFDAVDALWPTCIEITSTPTTTVMADQSYTYDVDAVADPQPVTYSLNNPPAGMTINPSTGVISWTPTILQAGPNQIEVQVTNGAKSTSQLFTIYVEAEHELYLPMIVRQ